MRNVLVAIAMTMLAAAPCTTRAADLGLPPRPSLAVAQVDAAVRDYLDRHAVLLMIRATFNVIAPEQIETSLASDLRRIGSAGPAPGDLARLDRDLLAEGSYYLVSLRYLIEAGGAAWPANRPEHVQAGDALVKLDGLQDALVDAVAAGGDPLPILREAQHVLALTEGFQEVPDELDRFAGRDEMVARLIATLGPRANA